MINREIGEKIRQFAAQYPVVTITGPRQSGKTTLRRMVFPDRQYVSLEVEGWAKCNVPSNSLMQFK